MSQQPRQLPSLELATVCLQWGPLTATTVRLKWAQPPIHCNEPNYTEEDLVFFFFLWESNLQRLGANSQSGAYRVKCLER